MGGKLTLTIFIMVVTAALMIPYGIYRLKPAGEESHHIQEVNRTMRAALYDDSGAWNESVVALTRLLTWMNYTVETVDSAGVNHGALEGFSLFCVPGGDMYHYSQSINEAGKQSIRSFVKLGGSYLGVCGGAYFALDTIVWRGETLPMEPLHLVNGTAIGPLDDLAAYPEYNITGVTFTEHGRSVFNGLNDSVWILYYWGPALNVEESPKVSVLGVYIGNGLPAIVVSEFGSGRVALVGTHPEIEENDARDGSDWGHELDDRGSDWEILKSLILWVNRAN